MEKKKTADRGREFLFARRVQQRMLAFDELPRVRPIVLVAVHELPERTGLVHVRRLRHRALCAARLRRVYFNISVHADGERRGSVPI